MRSSGERLRLDHLVLAAAALDPDQRPDFFAHLPPEDCPLAAEVRRRLRAAEDLPEEFLETPPTEILESAAGIADAPEPPTGNERYDICECLGAGGMARVYRAFDRQLGRPVALKILSAGDPDTPRRVLREARAQARVRHDHVLDVYETGELGGQLYIAVRHVAGGTLADLVERGEPVSLEQRVRLVAQVAEGLHAAHREGLLHGDVKPSNVLLEETPDGELRAWIGDFGIATEMDSAGDGPLAGTPQLMAPELLRRGGAAPDRRSDVYSLGATLHQVLTGELPPRDGSRWSDSRKRRSDLPPDLAAVVARCLAVDPAERYPSARAVARDLRRFLDGEVVGAYADRLVYRLSRFAARHRVLLAVAGVSALLLTAALAVAAVMGVRAVQANEVAEQRRGQAEELIDFMLLDLRDKLRSVGRLELLDDVGERAMAYFASVPEEELSDDELARRATALHQIGEVRMNQGDMAGADRPLQESLQLARRLAQRHPDDGERLFGLGQSEFWVGYALWRRGEPEAARPYLERYRDISQRLVAMDPDSLDWQMELSYARSNLGTLLQVQGDLPAALERFRSALEVDRRLVARAPDPQKADEWRFELAATHNAVGLVLQRMGRLEEAREHYEADLALRRALSERNPGNQRWRWFLGTSHSYLGNTLATLGEHAAARLHLEAARDVFDDLVTRDPDNTSWRESQVWCLVWLGRLDYEVGNAAAAGAAWRRADGLARELLRRDQELDRWRRLAGASAHHLALAEEGAPALEQARWAHELLKGPGAERPKDGRVQRWLAANLLRLGDLEAARGDREAARRAWRGAADALAPLLAEGVREPQLVALHQRALATLGDPAS